MKFRRWIDMEAVDVGILLVVQGLDNALIHEAGLLRGVENKVESLKFQLHKSLDILKDAYRRQIEGEIVRPWTLEIRDVAHEAEDVVEMFLVKAANERRRRGLFKCFSTKRGEAIDAIRAKLEDIDKKYSDQIKSWRQDFDLITQEELPDRNSDKVVGMEDEVKKLLRESVLNEQKKGLSIAVVEGMAGIGKTTLAHQIFNHPDVVNRFPFRAWVMVSSDVVTVLKVIVRSILGRWLDGSDKKVFQETLHRELQGKTYFIVLDNVWEKEHWESLKAAFPDERDSASRLLLTTRIKYIAKYDPRYTHYEMKLLHPDEGWELLAVKARLIDSGCSEELEPIGREIVKRCEGLPLTICTLGRVLSAKRTKDEWEEVLNNISFHLGSSVFEILKPYQNLSPDSKLCFLCLAFFKEGATIPAKALLRIWCIQGLIRNDGRRTMEERARDYLEELTYRNIIQIVDLTMEDRAKNVHSVLREVLLEERTKVALLLETVKEAEGMISSKHEPRHRVLYGGNLETLSRSRSKYLRSIFLLNNEGEGVDVDVSSVSHDFWKSCELLRILYLDGINLSTFPDSLRALVRLKYLMIRRHKIHPKCALDEVEDHLEAVKLPNWLGDLKYLEIVDMEGEKVEFPNDVALKMKSLCYFSACCVRGPISINTWENIETLKYIRQEDWIKCYSTLSSSCKVRKLGLFLDPLNRADEWSKVRASLESLKTLEHLQLWWNRFIPFDPQSIRKLHTLTKLKLRGKLSKCPDATIFPPNLSCLTLALSDLSDDLMEELSKLPELSYLKLVGNAYKPAERMQILSDGFLCLKVLTLKEMFHLKSIEKDPRGMPCLEKLRIQQCPSLQTTNLRNMSSSNVYPEEYLCYSFEL